VCVSVSFKELEGLRSEVVETEPPNRGRCGGAASDSAGREAVRDPLRDTGALLQSVAQALVQVISRDGVTRAPGSCPEHDWVSSLLGPVCPPTDRQAGGASEEDFEVHDPTSIDEDERHGDTWPGSVVCSPRSPPGLHGMFSL